MAHATAAFAAHFGQISKPTCIVKCCVTRNQFKRFGDLQEFRARAVGQWNNSATHVAFAGAMKLLMLEIPHGIHKEAKNSEEKDEQEDEDSEDMHRREESSPLVTRPS